MIIKHLQKGEIIIKSNGNNEAGSERLTQKYMFGRNTN